MSGVESDEERMDSFIQRADSTEKVGRTYLPHETFGANERRVKPLQEIDDEALDVASIVILIRHNDDAPVAKRFARVCGGVVLVAFNVQDLNHVLNLLVFVHLVEPRLAHVEELPLERVDTVEVAPNHGEAAHCESLGRVALREDERALLRLARARLVRIIELRNTRQVARLRRARRDLARFERNVLEHEVDDTNVSLANRFEELVAERALGAKFLYLRVEGFLRLRIEGCVWHAWRESKLAYAEKHAIEG